MATESEHYVRIEANETSHVHPDCGCELRRDLDAGSVAFFPCSAHDPSRQKLWVLTIDLGGPTVGPESSLHRTEVGAYDALVRYVDDQWERELGDTKRPEDDDEAIEVYFGESRDYGWTIREEGVGP